MNFSLEVETAKKKIKVKVTVIGDGSVGKTSLIQKFTQGIFKTDYVKTIGAQLTNYETEIDGYRIELIFWDIADKTISIFYALLFTEEVKQRLSCIV